MNTSGTAQYILHLTETIPAIISAMSEAELSLAPAAGKWSKKEILGHLIDSAANNHQRIIRTQYENATISYDQDQWNSLNNYGSMPVKDIINFWVVYNRHLAALISRIPSEHLSLQYNTGEGEPVTLGWLIGDYIDHMEHHLRQITGRAPGGTSDVPMVNKVNIHYSRATEQDVATLAAYRIEFLLELTGPQDQGLVVTLQQHLENYFRDAIKNKTYIGLLAKDGDNVVGTGGMTIRIQPGSFKNLSGITGYILNMYTIPAYRKQGVCSALLRLLIATGNELGMGGFELHATKDGEPVYRKYGFERHHEPTFRKFGFSVPEE